MIGPSQHVGGRRFFMRAQTPRRASSVQEQHWLAVAKTAANGRKLQGSMCAIHCEFLEAMMINSASPRIHGSLGGLI